MCAEPGNKRAEREFSIRSASLPSRDLHFKTLSQAKLKNDASVRFTQNDPIHSGMATTDSDVKSKLLALKILIALV